MLLGYYRIQLFPIPVQELSMHKLQVGQYLK